MVDDSKLQREIKRNRYQKEEALEGKQRNSWSAKITQRNEIKAQIQKSFFERWKVQCWFSQAIFEQDERDWGS